MELFFLGTGAGVPAKERNVSALVLHLLEERRTSWLFDCAEATQHQILHTNVKLSKLEKIFISHLHGDHIFGLPGLLSSRSFQGGQSELTVYGPKGIKDFIEVSLKISNTHIKYPLTITEIEPGIIFEDDTFLVEVKKVEHGIDSYGFRVVEKDLPGSLLVDKLKEIGVRPGPAYAKLKGGETVTLDDGRVIDGKNYVGSPKKGRVVAIIGDTRRCKAAYELASNADVLVHEATFSAEDGKQAYEFFHSTTKDAAEIAKASNAKKLIITHISSRYQGYECQRLLLEAQEIFEGTEIAEDFKSFTIDRRVV